MSFKVEQLGQQKYFWNRNNCLCNFFFTKNKQLKVHRQFFRRFDHVYCKIQLSSNPVNFLTNLKNSRDRYLVLNYQKYKHHRRYMLKQFNRSNNSIWSREYPSSNPGKHFNIPVYFFIWRFSLYTFRNTHTNDLHQTIDIHIYQEIHFHLGKYISKLFYIKGTSNLVNNRRHVV